MNPIENEYEWDLYKISDEPEKFDRWQCSGVGSTAEEAMEEAMHELSTRIDDGSRYRFELVEVTRKMVKELSPLRGGRAVKAE